MKGIAALKEAVKLAVKRYPEGIGAALYKSAVVFIGEAVRRAPIEFGTLRRSAYVGLPSPKERPRVELGFGVVYAKAQHEGNFRHKDGERYYFQNAINAKLGAVSSAIPSWATEAAANAQTPSSTYTVRPVIGPDRAQVRRKDVREKFRRGKANVRARLGR